MGGWDWGFKSAPKKPAAKAKPVSPAAAEKAEIDEIKRKAAAEVKAEQEEGNVSSETREFFCPHGIKDTLTCASCCVCNQDDTGCCCI